MPSFTGEKRQKVDFGTSKPLCPLAMSCVAYAALALGFWAVFRCVYNAYLHPLRTIPGPALAKLSRWWLFHLEMRENPHIQILKLHRKYGMMFWGTSGNRLS